MYENYQSVDFSINLIQKRLTLSAAKGSYFYDIRFWQILRKTGSNRRGSLRKLAVFTKRCHYFSETFVKTERVWWASRKQKESVDFRENENLRRIFAKNLNFREIQNSSNTQNFATFSFALKWKNHFRFNPSLRCWLKKCIFPFFFIYIKPR